MAPHANGAAHANGANGSHGHLDFSEFYNVIDGQLTTTPTTRHNINPATKRPNLEVPVSTKEDVDRAVAAARRAFKSWSKTSRGTRVKALTSLAHALAEHKEDFAVMLTKEQGKPLAMARAEVDASCNFLRKMQTIEVEDDVIEDTDYRQVVTHYYPLGVCVGIIPWNVPLSLATAKLAQATLMGNTMIIKPSPYTPYSDLKLIELAQRFFPPGVLQALSGDESLGPLFTAHPDVDKISFTGSIATGKKVMEACSKTLKRLTLELGGNDPSIICPDVDVDKVAPKIVELAFVNSGQICIAIKRIYVHESIYPQFKEAMIKHTKTLKIGPGSEEGVTHGPVQNAMQYDIVNSHFADIEKENYKVAIGGKVDPSSPGYFFTPTIIDKPDENSRLVREEPFGPIVPLLTWTDEQDVIRRANDTHNGLGASVWSKDLARARRIGEQLEAGNVWINAHREGAPNVPFGGHKQSGLGVEWGLAGMKGYCNAQSLYLKKEP